MLRAIAYGFRNLLNLEGRDRRRVFWSYWLAVAAIVVSAPLIMERGFIAIFGDEPRLGETMPASGIPLIFGMFANYLLMIFLVFAACVRRLQDSGVGMHTALIVLGSHAIFATFTVFFSFLTNFGKVQDLPAWAVIIFVCMVPIALIVAFGTYWMLYLLLRKGTPGTNRYGPPQPNNIKEAVVTS